MLSRAVFHIRGLWKQADQHSWGLTCPLREDRAGATSRTGRDTHNLALAYCLLEHLPWRFSGNDLRQLVYLY
jgi:hypothetical protein